MCYSLGSSHFERTKTQFRRMQIIQGFLAEEHTGPQKCWVLQYVSFGPKKWARARAPSDATRNCVSERECAPFPRTEHFDVSELLRARCWPYSNKYYENIGSTKSTTFYNGLCGVTPKMDPEGSKRRSGKRPRKGRARIWSVGAVGG